jgi:hypothetical protein
MAVTENTYTGNGSSTNYSFTFPYLETTDIKVSLDGTNTNAYTLANATTIQFNTAPANGVAIRIYRQTDDSALAAQFYPGSAIRSQDLNDNFTQNLYVTQESNREATTASSLANTATTTANTAFNTANTASANATTALSTANTALTNSASAVSTANSANTSATTALNTVNTALSAVAEVVVYQPVANVAAIPGSPSDADAVAVVDSTGIQSFSPLSGLPAGFVGDSGLSVRILYSAAGSTWTWIQYYPNDPEDRYGNAITQAQSDILGLDATKLDSTTAATTYAPLANPTFTGTVTSTGPLTINSQNEIRFADSDSSHYVGFKSPGVVSTNKIWTLPNADGLPGQVLVTNGSASLTWASANAKAFFFSAF